MKLTKKLLKEVRVINAYDYAQGDPYLYYKPMISGRGYHPAGWSIHWPGHEFKGHWTDYGNKVFDVYNPRFDKETKFEEAKKWFLEFFHCIELARTPMGSWMDKDFVDKRNSELLHLLKEKQNEHQTTL